MRNCTPEFKCPTCFELYTRSELCICDGIPHCQRGCESNLIEVTAKAKVEHDLEAETFVLIWPCGEVECWGDEYQAREASLLGPGEAPQL